MKVSLGAKLQFVLQLYRSISTLSYIERKLTVDHVVVENRFTFVTVVVL